MEEETTKFESDGDGLTRQQIVQIKNDSEERIARLAQQKRQNESDAVAALNRKVTLEKKRNEAKKKADYSREKDIVLCRYRQQCDERIVRLKKLGVDYSDVLSEWEQFQASSSEEVTLLDFVDNYSNYSSNPKVRKNISEIVSREESILGYERDVLEIPEIEMEIAEYDKKIEVAAEQVKASTEFARRCSLLIVEAETLHQWCQEKLGFDSEVTDDTVKAVQMKISIRKKPVINSDNK